MKEDKKSSKLIILAGCLLLLISVVVISVRHFFLLPPVFSETETGILVLKIEGDKQDSVQIHLVNLMNNEINKMGLEVKSINAFVSLQAGFKQAHQQAKDIGLENNAFGVLWGECTDANKFQPRLTIVQDSTFGISIGDQIMSTQKVDEIDLPVEQIQKPIGLINFLNGYYQLTQNKYSKAIPYFEKSLKSSDQTDIVCINLLLYLGLCYHEIFIRDMDKSALNQASKYFNRAIKLNPKKSIGYFDRGNVYFTSRSYDKALSDYNKAISINSDYPSFFNNRGNVFFIKEKYDLALFDYNIAIELNPRFADAFFNRGNVYYKQIQYDLALSDFNAVIEINPIYAAAYLNRGYIYFLKDQFNLALFDYNKSIEMDPKYIEAYKKRAILYEEEGQIQKALSDRNRIIELKPDDYFAYIDRGLIYTNEKQFDRAISDYNNAIDINRKSADAYYCIAFTYHIMGKSKEAISAYKKFIEYSSPKDLDNVKSAMQSIKELEKLNNMPSI